MAVVPFKEVSWSDNEPMDTEKLRQMAQNERTLLDMTPEMFYNGYGVPRKDGIKIMAGMTDIAATKQTGISKNVLFGTFFSTGCHPIITTGLLSATIYVRVHLAVRGINTQHPDHRGFNVAAAANELDPKKNYIPSTIWVCWHAIGY